MRKGVISSITDALASINTRALPLYAAIFVFGSLILGTLVRFILENLGALIAGGHSSFRVHMLLEPATWLIGFVISCVFLFIFAINGWFGKSGALGRSMLGSKSADKDVVMGSLENSRFLTDEERDKYFPKFTYETLPQMKNDGVPVRAVLNKKGVLEGNFKPGVHALVIGASAREDTRSWCWISAIRILPAAGIPWNPSGTLIRNISRRAGACACISTAWTTTPIFAA